jgi:ribosome biogenesis GTPase / thiamine phosphate phosphatase
MHCSHESVRVKALRPGLVIATYGRHCLIETDEGQRLICHPRGKKSQTVVGDRVQWQPPPDGQGDEGIIESIDPRRNLFYRQDEMRTKSFAANLDRVLILIAADPEFSESQLSRALIAAEAEGIQPLIVLNKHDLREPFDRAWAKLEPYRHMGYTVLPLAIKPNVDTEILVTLPPDLLDSLLLHLQNHATLVLGPSGAGKSSLINRLVPGAAVLTGEVSRALNSGKHTTTSTTWYWLDGINAGQGMAANDLAPNNPTQRSALIDSPGFQEFGLNHIKPMQLASCMPDFKPHATACRFYNCTHRKEPGCAVMAEVKSASGPGSISEARYKIYSDLFEELSQTRY